MLRNSNIPHVAMPVGGAILKKRGASIDDTLAAIEQIVNEKYLEVNEVAERLRGNSDYQTCENIWNHARKFKYQEDDSDSNNDDKNEWLRTPARTFHEGVADCDCMTIYVLSLLKCLGIKGLARMVAWEEEKWAHIYTVAIVNNEEVVIDFIPEVSRFNQQLKFSNKMDLYILNGTKTMENEQYVLAGAGTPNAANEVIGQLAKLREGLNNDIQNNTDVLGCGNAAKNEIQITDRVIIAFNFPKKINDVLAEAQEESQFKDFYKVCHSATSGEPLSGALIDKLKNVGTKVVNTVKNVGSNIKEAGAAIKNGEGAGAALDNLREGVNSLNPVTIAARNAFMTLVRRDFANLGRSLYVGSLTPAQAESQYKFTPNEHAKTKALYDKVWAKMQNMGQAKANFDMDIKTGAKAAGVLNGLNGLAVDPVSAVAMAAKDPALGENVKATGGIVDSVMEMLKGIFNIFKSKEKLAVENNITTQTNNEKSMTEEQKSAAASDAAPNNTDGWLKRTWSDPKKKWWLIGGSLGLVLIIVLVMWLTMRKPKIKKPLNGRKKYAIQVRPIRRKVKQPKQLAMRFAGAQTPNALAGKKRKVVAKNTKKRTTKKRR